MAKGTMLDRLAEAMGTLNKRPRKGLTPRQRVANAQRWNSLADISEDERFLPENIADTERGVLSTIGLRDKEDGYRADNPFLSDNIYKYEEQSDFLDWCRYHRVEPNGRNLKQFRWETYQTLPYRQRQWIANKDAIKSYLGPEMYGYDEQELGRINTLDELENYLQTRHPEDDWPRHYPMQDSPVFESPEEFPDNFDYMWRY